MPHRPRNYKVSNHLNALTLRVTFNYGMRLHNSLAAKLRVAALRRSAPICE